MKTTKKIMLTLLNFGLVILLSFSNYSTGNAKSQTNTESVSVLEPNAAIVAFNKTTPANGSIINVPADSYRVLLWTDALAPSSDRYQYCIDQTNNNSCDGNNWKTRVALYSGGPAEFTLAPGKTYYWQVRVRDADIYANAGAWWSFSTSNVVPAFSKTAPANGSSIPMPGNTYYLLQWTDLFLPSSDRYQYCIDQTNNNSCDGNNWKTRSSLYSGSDEFILEYGKTYYWQVKARDTGTQADGGTWWSFSISGSAPSLSKITPANGAVIAMPASTYYLLQWTNIFLPSSDRYQYCIDQTNNNSCDGNNWVTRNSLYSGAGEFTLQNGKTYYWQVKARDAGTQADGGAWWSFTVSGAVPSFSKTTPANGSSIPMPSNSYYLLQWTDLFLPSSDRYQYCIDKVNNNSCDTSWVTRNSLYSGGVGDITLEYGKTYYWQVRARDAGTVADGGAWWSFTISGSAPTLNKITPSNGAAIAMPDSTYYLLQWSNIFLPSSDRYQYCIDQTNNNACDTSWITRNSLYSGAGEFTLQYGKTYYWQVKARDAGIVADGGTWWSFSTPALLASPSVTSIVRTTPPDGTPIADLSVTFTITFSQNVTGVDIGDFSLDTTIPDATIISVDGTDNTNVRTVVVNTGTTDGTIRLDFSDNDSVQNSQATPIGGVGAGNGSFTSGEVYTIDKP